MSYLQRVRGLLRRAPGIPARIRPEEIIFSASDEISHVANAVRHLGVALIKKVLAPGVLERGRAEVEAFYTQRRHDVAAGRFETNDLDWIVDNGLSGPNLWSYVQELFVELSASKVSDIAHEYLETEVAVVPINHLLFRRVDEDCARRALSNNVKHGFHQDHDLIPTAFPMNMWLPLSKVDENTRGLSVVLPPSERVHPLPLNIDDYLSRTNGAVWSPEMQVGDVLIFNHLTIHGGYVKLDKPNVRYSVEFRLGRKSELPLSYEQEPNISM